MIEQEVRAMPNKYSFRVARCGDYVGANRTEVYASMHSNMQRATPGEERIHAHEQITDALASGLLTEEQGKALYTVIGF